MLLDLDHTVRQAAAGALLALLCGCSGGNGALVASGGADDVAAMGRIEDEYGAREPDAIMPVTIADEQYSYRIWISRNGRRIMAQTGSTSGAAAAGFVRGLTGGLVKGDLDYEPFRQAATNYLIQSRGPACILSNSRKLTHIGWEWDFDCRAKS